MIIRNAALFPVSCERKEYPLYIPLILAHQDYAGLDLSTPTEGRQGLPVRGMGSIDRQHI